MRKPATHPNGASQTRSIERGRGVGCLALEAYAFSLEFGVGRSASGLGGLPCFSPLSLLFFCAVPTLRRRQ
jgi:hypothetical protein